MHISSNDRAPLPRRQIEWPTILLLSLVYLGFLAAICLADLITLWIAVPLIAVLIAQHSSLQHEVLHGHPFRSQHLNEALIFPAMGLFVPYLRFKATHLQHHHNPSLTDPYDDPETNYLDPDVFHATPAPVRALLRLNNTLLGRMVLGPGIGLLAFYRSESKLLWQGRGNIRMAWALHLAGLVPVALLIAAAEFPIAAYLIAAYGGMALLKIRTFLEHRAHESCAGRSVIIEDRGPLALLFLNNNLHAVHHAHPGVPWYALPDLYQSRREAFLSCNLGYRYDSYREIFARHLLSAKDEVAHPLWVKGQEDAPRRTTP